MDWFKNIFHVFKDDEKDDFIENKRERKVKATEKNDNTKDMNTRIVYQYPKGSSRFPLIPKEPVANSSDRKKRNAKNSNNTYENLNVEKEQNKNKHSVTAHKIRPSKLDEIIPKKDIPKKIKPEIKRNGPFRPTEIPSPIYGYERPKNSTVIEYELTGFLQDKDISKSLNDYLLEEKRMLEQDHSFAEFNQEVFEEFAATMEIPEKIFEVECDNGQEGFMIGDLLNNEPIDPFDPIEPSIEPFEPIIVPMEPLEPVEPTKPTIEPFEPQEPMEPMEPQEPSEPMEPMEPLEPIVPKEPTEPIKPIIEPMEPLEPIKPMIEPLEPIEPAELELQTEVIEQNQEEPTRSHIPFNVLMLKQDRQKLEMRKNSFEIDEASAEEKVQPQPEINAVKTEPESEPESNAPLHDNEFLNYKFPEEDLLLPPVVQEPNEDWLLEQEQQLNQTLADFNVGAKVVNVTQGPSVTRFEVQPDPGVKVNKITNLQDDIKLSLAAKDIRIEAPIPGKHTIGIEVPNKKSRPVLISEILGDSQFSNNPSPLTAALGLDISGNPVVTDLRKMPHGLIAGATGSGKSVCINSILTSLLYKANPQDVKLLLIDPKMVELAPYNHIPHLVSPVITDAKAATVALKWAVEEMDRRYELFAHTGVREITRFNELAESTGSYSQKLPFILIVIDELADLMMVAPADVEEAVCRIAQKARACGIHLILATQRPSVDVITGLIKANIPTRIAFSVSSQIDSRTIIDMNGADKLLGRGDMLFLENGSSKPVRLQGTYISDTEIDNVVEHVRRQGEPNYLFEQTELLKKAQINEDEDELFFEACEFIVEQGVASTSSLQRKFKMGYNRAARLIDLMEQNGFISESKGSKPRDVLISEEELEKINDTSTN